MTTENPIKIRLYDHQDSAALALLPDEREGGKTWCPVEGVYGWDYQTGDEILIDGTLYALTVYDRIQTGDARGNYLLAEAVRA